MSFDNKITIMPFVSLYKNVFQDVDSLFDIVKNFQPSRLIAEWEPWYELGSRTKIENTHLNELDENELRHKYLFETFNKAIWDAYNDYIDTWSDKEIINKYINKNKAYHQDWKYVFGNFDVNWDDFKSSNSKWNMGAIEFLQHDHTKKSHKDLAIGYHIDAFNHKDFAGPKAILSSTVYLNDDYTGGHISFLNEFTDEIINYKPQKGDLIVFPSGKPFFHAALPLENTNKYLVRNFMLWNYEGSEKYNNDISRFGKEQFDYMEEYIREAEDLLGLYQKDVYLPGVGLFDRERQNGIPFFAKEVKELIL